MAREVRQKYKILMRETLESTQSCMTLTEILHGVLLISSKNFDTHKT